MNSLDIKGAVINELKLSQGYYFQSLLQEAVDKQVLSEKQVEQIQFGVLELMTKEVDRYTNGESSSVPVEKAQEILQSIAYLIGAYLKTVPDMRLKLELLTKETMTVLFFRGLDVVAKMRTDSIANLNKLCHNDRKLRSIAYHDTIFTGLKEALHDYNMEFGAYETGGSIDYPLMIDPEEYLGMEYIYRYIKRISLEDTILRKFKVQKIHLILHYFDVEAEQLLLNLCELTVINALGCELLHKDCRELAISHKELGELKNILTGKNKDEIGQLLNATARLLCEELELLDEPADYLMSAIPEFAVRLSNNYVQNTLERFFIITEGEIEEPEELYEGRTMEDEELRDLIQEIGDLDTLEDKITLIRERVRSILDLIELLEECFYPDEYLRVYQLLGDEEVRILKKSLLLEAGHITLEDYEPSKDWQRQLLLYHPN